MLLLVIDTSLQGLVIGLVTLKSDRKAYEINEIYGSSIPQEAAARLPELCASLLSRHHKTIKDLDSVLVSHGPGSFTGIKIGLSFAAGWNRAGTPVKIFGVSSFMGLLKQRPQAKALLLPATQTAGYFVMKSEQRDPSLGVIDLSHSSVAAVYDESLKNLSDLSPTQLSPVEILGSWPRLEEWLNAQSISWNSLDTSTLYHSVVAGMVEEFVAKSTELSEGKLVPIYLRKSAPEEKLDLAQAKK